MAHLFVFFPLKYLRSSILVLLLLCTACSAATLTSYPTQVPSSSLPGQQFWKEGVSSFLFGTNDTQEWYSNNVETSAAIQQALKDAHFTLMRTFFFDKSLADGHSTTDAEIEQRLKTIENSGMTCLGVLFNIFDVNFDKHVVTYAGPRCQIYEFGNESDYNGISIDTYLKQWNEVIPLLRHINPNAKFIGPATHNNLGNNNFMMMFLQGVRSSGVLPDAISFHWYPCYQDIESSCLFKANSYGQAALVVHALVQHILGKNLPVGITEWNYFPSYPPPAYGDDPNFISNFTTDALLSMIQADVVFACQFDAASGTFGLDMFDYRTNEPKSQFITMNNLIQQYRT